MSSPTVDFIKRTATSDHGRLLAATLEIELLEHHREALMTMLTQAGQLVQSLGMTLFKDDEEGQHRVMSHVTELEKTMDLIQRDIDRVSK